MTEGQQRIGVGVVGATGYGGQELVRLLARHPGADLKVALGSSQSDQPRTLPGLARIWDGEITAYSPDVLGGCDVVFLSTPEAFAATSAAELLARGHRVIDLSGAFRLKDPALRARFYPATPDPLPDGTVYSLPEFDAAAVPGARLVSCPGCYPTAAMLSLLPLTRDGLLQGEAIVDAKSGISGAGKAASERTHFSENHGSVAAYGLFGHRHTPEMEQALGLPVTFTPHLVPLDRGILSTTYARLKPGVTAAHVGEALRDGVRQRVLRAADGRSPAGDQARRAHELLRHRLEGGRADGPPDRRGRARQPAQGRGWPGRAAVQPALRLPGAGGPAVSPAPVLVKFGGELVETPERLAAVGTALAALAAEGPLVVVHGGGREIDAELASRGVPKQSVDGLRITDAATLDAVVAVLAGTINTRLVAHLVGLGHQGRRPDRRGWGPGALGAGRGARDGRRRAGRPRPGGRAGCGSRPRRRLARARGRVCPGDREPGLLGRRTACST